MSLQEILGRVRFISWTAGLILFTQIMWNSRTFSIEFRLKKNNNLKKTIYIYLFIQHGNERIGYNEERFRDNSKKFCIF